MSALASAKAAVQEDSAAFNQWMTYWVVMSMFAVAEVLVDFFVSWVPFYFEAKIVLIIWLTLPRYQGASQIYRKLLHPYLVQYEGDIDNGIEGMRAEATRRIQSFGASAATEIAKAVSRQGFSAKEQLLTRVLGIATTGATETIDDRAVAGRSSNLAALQEAPPPTSPQERQAGFAMADDAMILEFTQVLREGIFAETRLSTKGGDAAESWRPHTIRLLRDRVLCITEAEQAGQSTNGEASNQLYEVQAVAAGETDGSVLVLHTDQGAVDVSFPEQDDRDSMLAGFELLLATSQWPAATEYELPPRNEPGVVRVASRRWELPAGADHGLVIDSTDEESDADADDADKPMPMLPLRQPSVRAE